MRARANVKLDNYYFRSMSMSKNICIMYPNSCTSLILGRRLLREEVDLFLYAPKDVHRRMADTIPCDLEIAALGLTNEVREIASLEDLETMDFVIYPSFDVLPDKKRSEFAQIMGREFR